MYSITQSYLAQLGQHYPVETRHALSPTVDIAITSEMTRSTDQLLKLGFFTDLSRTAKPSQANSPIHQFANSPTRQFPWEPSRVSLVQQNPRKPLSHSLIRSIRSLSNFLGSSRIFLVQQDRRKSFTKSPTH